MINPFLDNDILYIETLSSDLGQSLSESSHKRFDDLMKYFELPFKAADFHKGKNGKPYLTGYPFHFSIAHSRNLLVIGFSLDPIGVDCQFHQEVRFDDIAARFFSADEHSQLTSTSDKPSTFYRTWCLKEAVLKYLGTGFQLDSRTFSTLENDAITSFITEYQAFSLPTINTTIIDSIKQYTIAAVHHHPMHTISSKIF